MTDETQHITEASLHRAVPRQPVEHRHFTPSRTPFSIWFIKVLGYLYGSIGACLVFAGAMIIYARDTSLTAFSGPIAVVIGLLVSATAAFLLAGYHVAKAVIDMRDMMRHRSG